MEENWLRITAKFIYFLMCAHHIFFFLDRRNDKAIINSYTQVEVPEFEPRHDIRRNNFAIFAS